MKPPSAPLPPQRQFTAAAVLLAILCVVYAATVCRTVATGDAGELAVALSTWGVAHAPGFPLLSLIGNVVTHLIPFGEPALVLNLLNALFAALACAVLAAAVSLVTRSRSAGFVAGLALGTSRIFWQQALALEVFSLNALMAALLLFFLSRLLASIATPRPALWTLPASALAMSTAVTHHLTLAVVAVPVLLAEVMIVWQSRRALGGGTALRRILWRGVAAGALGLLPLLYIPIAARLDPPLSWGDARDLGGLVRLLLRQDFGSGTLISPAIVVSQVMKYGEGVSPLGQRNFIAFWADIPRSLGWVFPVLPLAGLAWAARKARPLAVLALAFLAMLWLFFARVNTPLVEPYSGIAARFFSLPHLVLAFFAGCGVARLVASGYRVMMPAPAVAALAALATGVPMLALNWPLADQRTNTFARDFGHNLMAGMPERAIFFSTGDLFRNSFLYQRECLGRRRDLTLVDQDLLPAAWYVRQLRGRGAVQVPDSMTDPAGRSATGSKTWLDLIVGPAAIAPRRPAVALKFADDSYREGYRLLPMGMWSRVVPKDEPLDLRAWRDEYSAAVRQWDLASMDRQYRDAIWENSEWIFYAYALGQLAGLHEVVAVCAPAGGGAEAAARFAPAAGAPPEIPALRHAADWTGKRRADFLAHEADFLRECLADSLIPKRPPADSLLAARAMSLARASLALDRNNVQALQTIAALMASVPRYRDPLAEVRVRERIVRLRPGAVEELTPYFRLPEEVAADPSVRDPEIARQAEQARRRFVALLSICGKILRQAGAPEPVAQEPAPRDTIPAPR